MHMQNTALAMNKAPEPIFDDIPLVMDELVELLYAPADDTTARHTQYGLWNEIKRTLFRELGKIEAGLSNWPVEDLHRILQQVRGFSACSGFVRFPAVLQTLEESQQPSATGSALLPIALDAGAEGIREIEKRYPHLMGRY